jgi:hypothetical protein
MLESLIRITIWTTMVQDHAARMVGVEEEEEEEQEQEQVVFSAFSSNYLL